MKNDITELVFILDRSGSMSGMEKDVIGGFNAMIEKQKNLGGSAYVTTVLFSNSASTLHDRVDIKNVEPMTDAQYQVNGCTALLDAIGETIRHIADIHRYARREDVPEHTVFVITTDGMENSSRAYSSSEVKKMIKHEQEKYGWEFLFVAANIDAVETAASIGISQERAANYRPTSAGTRSVYEAMDCAVSAVRSNKRISAKWKEQLNFKDKE